MTTRDDDGSTMTAPPTPIGRYDDGNRTTGTDTMGDDMTTDPSTAEQQAAERTTAMIDVTDGSASFGARLRRRAALFGLSWFYVLLFPAAVALFALATVGLATIVVTAGVFILLAVVPLLALNSAAERKLARAVLGVDIPAWYRPRPSGNWLSMMRGWMGDKARWRDYLLVLVTMVVSLPLALISSIFLLVAAFYLIFPFLVWVTPPGVFDMNLGFMNIDSQGRSFLAWIVVGIALLIWWNIQTPLMVARASIARAILSPSRDDLEARVAEVSRSRAESIDYSAAELRRIERDLHDGAQARLVSLGMSLGMAEELIRTDPEAAARLIAEARGATTTALGDLRTVVRGIHPPVLADRGLVGAVQALALDVSLSVSVQADLPGRPPAPVESAAYFAIAECIANVLKHAEATQAGVRMNYSEGKLRIRVFDDGRGGADPTRGSGMAGIARRLAAFDGTMEVNSPAGGPTIVTLELPCELSSPRT